MKTVRKFLAIGMAGLVLGGAMSVVAAPSAGARTYWCDQRIESMEKKSAQDYKKGKITDEEYAKIQDEIAYHKELWGC